MLSGSKGIMNGGIIIRVTDLEKKIVSLKPQSIQDLQDKIKKIEKNSNNNIENNNKIQKDIEEIKNCSCNCDCYEKSQGQFEEIKKDIEELKNNNGNSNNNCCENSQFKIDYLSDKIEKLEKILLSK